MLLFVFSWRTLGSPLTGPCWSRTLLWSVTTAPRTSTKSRRSSRKNLSTCSRSGQFLFHFRLEIFFHFPSTSFPPVRPFLASHLWPSWLGLGNQLGSTTDHLQLLPTQHIERSKYDEGRADRVIANIGCWNYFWYAQNTLVLGNHPDGACEYRIEQKKESL